MAKNSGSTRAVSSNNAAASRSVNGGGDINKKGQAVHWATKEDIRGLPKGWSMNALFSNTYNTNLDFGFNTMHAIKEIYPNKKISFGSTEDGVSIECKNVALAKDIAKHAKKLEPLFHVIKYPGTKERRAKYEKLVEEYIEKHKQK